METLESDSGSARVSYHLRPNGQLHVGVTLMACQGTWWFDFDPTPFLLEAREFQPILHGRAVGTGPVVPLTRAGLPGQDKYYVFPFGFVKTPATGVSFNIPTHWAESSRACSSALYTWLVVEPEVHHLLTSDPVRGQLFSNSGMCTSLGKFIQLV